MQPDIVKHYFALRQAALNIPRSHHDSIMAAFGCAMTARRIVELGSGPGYGTKTFIDIVNLNGGGLVHSIDIVESESLRKYGGSRQNFYIFNGSKEYPNVQFEISDSIEASYRWNNGPFDILYCDSDHSKKHVRAELDAWTRHNPRIVFVDDTLDPNEEHGSPLEAVIEFCEANPQWTWWNIAIHTGLAILVPNAIAKEP